MIYLILVIMFLALLLGPQLWVRYILSRYSRHLPDLPGTGGELAVHLLKRFDLEQVEVNTTEPGRDHYNPQENTVCLSPDVYDGKSLTAVAVAAHEVGHAIQFNRQEPVSHLRSRYFGKAMKIQRTGMVVLMLIPVITAIIPLPHTVLLTALVGVGTMFVSVGMYAAILPEEWDASFNKALPVLLQGEYISAQQLDAVKKILTACALTYVAAALADILRLWRWLALLRAMR